MVASSLTIAEYGDGAVMVTVPSPDESVRRRVIRDFRARLLESVPPGVDDVVSGLESLLVEYDVLTTTPEQVAFTLGALANARSSARAAPVPRRLILPLLVTADTAPDLEAVALELSLSPDELIRRIERSVLTVSLLAAAMAPMMHGLDVSSPIRRQSTPRTDVPPGSLMVAGRNALVQPYPGPTGWRVIGRSPLQIVDINRASPVSYAPDDVVEVHRVDADEYARLQGRFWGEDR